MKSYRLLGVAVAVLGMAACHRSADKAELRARVSSLEGQVFALRGMASMPAVEPKSTPPSVGDISVEIPQSPQQKAEAAQAAAAWKAKVEAARAVLPSKEKELAAAKAELEGN